MCFSFIVVKAEERIDDTPIPDSDSAKDIQKESMKKYCLEDEKIEGCLFDSSSDLYMKSESKLFQDEIYDPDLQNDYYTFNFPKGIELTKGYQAFDANGKAVFAGCYRYVKETKDNKGPAGTYFLFQIVAKQGKKCKVVDKELVVSTSTGFRYSGNIAFNNFVYKMAQYQGWIADDNGPCPAVFGFYANTTWYNNTAANKYAFSNSSDNFLIKTITFGKEKVEKGRPGCAVEDVDGKQEAKKILDEQLKNIKNKACPAKIEDMTSYQNEFEVMYNDILNNKFNDLWSKGLIDQVIMDNAKMEIRQAIKDKITECQYSICKIAYGSQDLINSYLGDKCKNGCRLTVIMPQSNSPSSKCYSCPFNGENVLQWTDINTNGCKPIENLSKDQCVGTESDLLCRNCLIEAYKHGRLTDKQMSCLAGNEIAKELTDQNLENANERAASGAVDDQIERNREKIEEIYNNLSGGLSYDFNIPIGELTGCSQILGKNLTALVKASITILQIIAAIIAILKGMMTLIPPIIAHDADALKKASKTLITMAIILVIIFLFKPLLRFIGSIVDFDTSCIL